MKIPKLQKTYCPKCKKHTEHKVSNAKKRTPGSTRPMGYGSKHRAKLRGVRGAGSRGRYSRPPINKRKMMGKKTSKKTDLRFQCSSCKKIRTQNKGIRAKKQEFM
jgi:large subunit ribosomal protein L44e